MKNTSTQLSLADLEQKKSELLARITSLEKDIQCPLEQDFSEQAGQLANRLIHIKLLEVERENFKSVKNEISKLTAPLA
jgi:hypothetical protein